MRPHVVINAAMTVDGKIALRDGTAARLSNDADIRRVHRLRARVDAILVGVGTILTDDPKLTIKPEYAKARARNPMRIVLDTHGKTPKDAYVLDGKAPTLIVTSVDCDRTFANAEVLRCGKDEVDLTVLLDLLGERRVRSLLVEGGSTVIWSFLHQGLADELKVFVGSLVLGGRSTPTLAGGQGAGSLGEGIRLRLDRARRLQDGILLEYSVVG